MVYKIRKLNDLKWYGIEWNELNGLCKHGVREKEKSTLQI